MWGNEGEASSAKVTFVKILAGINAQHVQQSSVGQRKSVVQGDSQRGFDSQVRQRLRGAMRLWICKSKEKTKLRKLLQTLRIFYSSLSVA
jgi:hypothetical protein